LFYSTSNKIEQNSCVIVKLYANFGGIDDLSKLGKEIYLISKTVRFLAHPVYSTMKTEDAESLGRQRAKPSKIKAGYSWQTCKNCLYLCAPL